MTTALNAAWRVQHNYNQQLARVSYVRTNQLPGVFLIPVRVLT